MVQTVISADRPSAPPALPWGVWRRQAWIARPAQPIAAAGAQGPLSGWTFAAKDNIDVAGLPTTAACAAFAYEPAAHAAVVARLLGAGAAVSGKTTSTSSPAG